MRFLLYCWFLQSPILILHRTNFFAISRPASHASINRSFRHPSTLTSFICSLRRFSLYTSSCSSSCNIAACLDEIFSMLFIESSPAEDRSAIISSNFTKSGVDVRLILAACPCIFLSFGRNGMVQSTKSEDTSRIAESRQENSMVVEFPCW